jgi:quinone-modifying oxidoreductase subunit QmoC
MNDVALVEPDLNFIKEINANGGRSLKKCMQCASCSVACKLSPDRQPFPRKEMVYASWGLKDRLVGNPDIWLCYNCGDCSELCPRDVRPGDVLGTVRKLSVKAYARPEFLFRWANDPKLLPLLLLLPVLVIGIVGSVTGLLNLHMDDGPLVFAHHVPVGLIELIFIPLSVFSGLVFLMGIKRLLVDMQANYARRGLHQRPIEPMKLIKTLIKIFPSILMHKDFSTCGENRQRKLSHLLVSVSFVNLALVAGIFVFALYILNAHGPYSQWNPVKIFANLSGIALIVGGSWLLRDRIKTQATQNTYFDWYLLFLVLLLGVTGMFTQILRLLDAPMIALMTYFLHLIMAFNLIALLPFTKMAHFVYRIVAIAFRAYALDEATPAKSVR